MREYGIEVMGKIQVGMIFFIISLNFNYQYLHIFSVAKKYYSRRDGNSEVPALVNKYESVEEVDIFEEEDEDDDWDWDD